MHGKKINALTDGGDCRSAQLRYKAGRVSKDFGV